MFQQDPFGCCAENKKGPGRWGSKNAGSVTGAGIQTKDGGGFVQVGSNKGGEEWLNFGHILKEELKVFANGLEGGCE